MTGESIKKKLLATTLLVGLSGGVWAGAALAQASDDPVVVEQADEDDGAAVQERVLVTGSRIKRDSFSSTSPLQVLTSEVASESGLFDTTAILTSQPVFQGLQVGADISAGGFVTDNGVGTSTVGLRGLGADRTLILINGRRLAPSGSGGAPSNPNIEFIPSSLISSIETITDGASAIYGSDAIAGAVNIILRDEFDGFRVDATYTQPQADGGTSQRYGVTWGTVGERGSFLLAAEYNRRERIAFNQRDFTRSDEGFNCNLDIEVNPATGETARNCGGAIVNNIVNPFTGFAATANPALGTGVPLQNAGVVIPGIFATGDLDDLDFRSGPFEFNEQIAPLTQRLSIFSSGKANIDVLGHNTTAFVEFGYSDNQTNSDESFGGQIFPTVPTDNPFNPFGAPVTPIFIDPVLRGQVESEIIQTRFFGGFQGDVDFFEGATNYFNDWSYEISAGYTRSVGRETRPALLENNLALSLATSVENPDGSITCGLDLPAGFGFLTPQTCVPVNLFSPTLFSSDPNNPPAFATQAELDFLDGVSTASTVVEQTLIGGFVGGPLFENPFFGGDIQASVGFEWREDSFDSGTDTIRRDGLASGFSEDPLSVGAVDLLEFYGEVYVPLIRDVPFIKELSVEGAVRYLQPEFTQSDVVYSVKGAYRPFDWLLLRSTYGTSYRAPNARETFLAGITSFVNGFGDPCVVPANVQAGDPDQRDPLVLANCAAQGVDPLTLGLTGVPSFTAATSGNQNLLPEQSTALTAGFVIDQPFTDWFNATLGVSYFETEISDAPATLGAGAIVGTCLNSPDFANEPACDLFNRDPATGFIDTVQVSPLNLSLERVQGVDININVSKRDIQAFGREWGFSTDAVATLQTALENQFDIDSPVINQIDDIGNARWRLNFQSRLSTGPWSVFYRFDFIDATRDRNAGLSTQNSIACDGDFSFGGAPTAVSLSAGCFGVNTVDNYFNHTMSARFAGDAWSVQVGINNLTDRQPPQLDQNALSGALIGNVPAGVGFDTRGRSFFVNLIKEF